MLKMRSSYCTTIRKICLALNRGDLRTSSRLNDQWEKNHQKKYEGPKHIFRIEE
jgi:hypothetical protein